MDKRTFIIRKATHEDATAIYAAHMASIREICSKDYSPEQIASWTAGPVPESYVQAMKDGECMFVAESADGIIGFSGIKNDEIRAVYVHPNSVRTGAGKQLLQAVETEGFSQNFPSLWLHSSKTARDFYLAHGWHIEEESSHELRCGMQIPCIKMRKQANQAL